MTLAAILAAHTRVLPHRDGEGVARCGVETVGTPHATPATPATPKKQTPELRTQGPSYTVQPDASNGSLIDGGGNLLRADLLALADRIGIDPAPHVHRPAQRRGKGQGEP